MTTPVEELKAAAFQLRNPFHLPGLRVAVDPDLAAPLAAWLEAYAADLARTAHPSWQPMVAELPLAVARALNGGGS